MATATFIQQGIALDYRPSVDTPAGTVVVLADLVGVAVQAIKANQLGSLAVEGVFEFPKNNGIALEQGQNVFWDANENVVESWQSSGFHHALGKVAESASGSKTKVRVRLSQ